MSGKLYGGTRECKGKLRWQVVDALSEYSFYEKGIVEHPIVSSNHISVFLKNKVPQPWVYYCCGQSVTVPNRFFAMPSWRNRIMGVLMYLHGIKGFLHWGFNFYNSQYSISHIDPFFNTHASYAFPSGDAFLVYPGPDENRCHLFVHRCSVRLLMI